MALIQADTTNPPGEEMLAAKILEDYFQQKKIPFRLIESAPGRGNMVAEIGQGDQPPLYFLSHLDVVTANEKTWRYPPFCGQKIDGEIWGRGALDTKQLTAIQAVVMALLYQEEKNLKRRIVFLATADEEGGGSRFGLKFLLSEYPELFSPGYALNEGGGFTVQMGDSSFYLLETAQKGKAHLKIESAFDMEAHVSCPPEETPLKKVITALSRIYAHQPPITLTATTTGLFQGLATAMKIDASGLTGSPFQQEKTIAEIISCCESRHLKDILKGAARTSFSPHVVEGGTHVSQLPTSARAQIDCRLLPGVTQEELISDIQALLGDLSIHWELEDVRMGYDSGPESHLTSIINSSIKEMDPTGKLLPFIALGNTDSQWLQEMGINCYGFVPMKGVYIHEVVSRVHGNDERIPVASLAFGLETTYRITKRFCLQLESKDR